MPDSDTDIKSVRVPKDPPGSPAAVRPPRTRSSPHRGAPRPPAILTHPPGANHPVAAATPTPHAGSFFGFANAPNPNPPNAAFHGLPSVPHASSFSNAPPTGIPSHISFHGPTPTDDDTTSFVYDVPSFEEPTLPSFGSPTRDPSAPSPAPHGAASFTTSAVQRDPTAAVNMVTQFLAQFGYSVVPPSAPTVNPSTTRPAPVPPPPSGPPTVPSTSTSSTLPFPGADPRPPPGFGVPPSPSSVRPSTTTSGSGSALFPDATLGSFRRAPRESHRDSQVRLAKEDRGAFGSKEYNINADKITKPPRPEFKFDYVEVDVLSDPTKFNQELASTITSYSASLTRLESHCKKFDLMFPLMIPETLQPDGVVSSTTKCLLFHHNMFPTEHIEQWQFLLNNQCIDPLDSDSSRLLEDHFLSCLTGRLLTEVTAEFFDLDDSIRGAATLIYMALRKLQSNSAAVVLAQQGFIMYFDLSKIKYEDVSLAVSWLKATVKNLSYTNDIPNKAVNHILSGMIRSHNRAFNQLCTAIEVSHDASTGFTVSASSAERCRAVYSVLDRLNSKYRDLVDSGRWLKAKPLTNTSSAFTASPNRPTNSTLSRFSKADIQALFSEYDVMKCFNPNCRSTQHMAKDCPKPFPADWEHGRPSRDNSSRGRGRGRSRERGRSRGPSRGTSASSRGSRGNSRDSRAASRDAKRRAPTPHAKSSLKQDKEKTVAFSQAYNVSASASGYDSEASEYDPSMAHAFLVARDNVASKE